MSQIPIPPEFNIKPTQVILTERPNPKTFVLDSLGSQGGAPMSSIQLHNAGMDPATIPSGHSAAAAAAQATMDMAKGITREHSLSQLDPTQVNEREGGTIVTTYDDARGEGRDGQVSNVYGHEVSGDPATITEALRQTGADPIRPAARAVYEAREVGYRQTEGMTPATQAAFARMLSNKGSEAFESLPAKSITANVQASTPSGMVMRPELMGADSGSQLMHEQLRLKSAIQQSAPAKPMAQYHPSQSNFERNDGFVNSATSPVPAYIPRVAAPVGASGPKLGVRQLGFLPPVTSPTTVRPMYSAPNTSALSLLQPISTQATAPVTRMPQVTAPSTTLSWATKIAQAKAEEDAAAKAAATTTMQATVAAQKAVTAQVTTQAATREAESKEASATRASISASTTGVRTTSDATAARKEAAARLAAARAQEEARKAAEARALAESKAIDAAKAKAALAAARAKTAAAKQEADARTPLQLSESQRRTPGPAPTQSGALVRQSGWVHNNKGERCAIYSDGKTRCELVPVATGGYDMNPGSGSADQRPPVPGLGTEDSNSYVGEDGLPRYVEEPASGDIMGIKPKTLILGGLAVLAGLGALAVITK